MKNSITTQKLGFWVLFLVLGVPGIGQDIEFVKFSKSTINMPIDIANAGDDRMFVVDQSGRIYIVQNDGTVLSKPFLDIRDRVPFEGSQHGLLGLTFHPNYATNGRFYVYYIGPNRETRISEFTVSSDPNVADPNSEAAILYFPNLAKSFADDHKGGGIKFGKDGLLYVTVGDGGKGSNGLYSKDLNSYLGKLIRIKVNGDGTSSFPTDNPFVGDATKLDGIWAYGLRNPWTLSVDRKTGDLYIGDVGADRWDEINFVSATSTGGINFGWPCFEGDEVWEDVPSSYICPAMNTTVGPILKFFQESQPIKVTITGGFVYRGTQTPYFDGYYIYSEAYSNEVFYAHKEGDTWIEESFGDKDLFLTSFGEDKDGELYAVGIIVTGYSSQGNHIYKVKLSAPGPGITLSSSSVTVNENAGTTKVSVHLNHAPASNVILNFASDDISHASVSPVSLTFTPANFDQDQDITITGVDDWSMENASANISVAVDATSDAGYAVLPSQNIAVTVKNEDLVAGTSFGNEFRVYPIPSNGEVFMEGIHELVKLDIIDISGKSVVWKETMEEGRLKLHGLPKGIFHVSALMKSGETKSVRIVIR